MMQMPRHLPGIRRYPRDGDSTGVRRYLPAGLHLAVFAALALAAAVATAGPARGQEELTLADFRPDWPGRRDTGPGAGVGRLRH